MTQPLDDRVTAAVRDTLHLLQRTGTITVHRADAPVSGLIASAVLAEVHRVAEAQTTAQVFAGLHRSAEETVSRVIALAERWQHTGDRKGGPLLELRAALAEPDAPAHRTQAAADTTPRWTVKAETLRYAEKLRRSPQTVTADGHTGWECTAGASLIIHAMTPGPGSLGTLHGCIYTCPDHQADAEARITAAGANPDISPAPPGHRWNPWPCGHTTIHGRAAQTYLDAFAKDHRTADRPDTTEG